MPPKPGVRQAHALTRSCMFSEVRFRATEAVANGAIGPVTLGRSRRPCWASAQKGDEADRP